MRRSSDVSERRRWRFIDSSVRLGFMMHSGRSSSGGGGASTTGRHRPRCVVMLRRKHRSSFVYIYQKIPSPSHLATLLHLFNRLLSLGSFLDILPWLVTCATWDTMSHALLVQLYHYHSLTTTTHTTHNSKCNQPCTRKTPFSSYSFTDSKATTIPSTTSPTISAP